MNLSEITIFIIIINLKVVRIFHMLLALLLSFTSCESKKDQQTTSSSNPTKWSERCFEYRGKKRHIHIKLFYKDDTIKGKYSEYVRDDQKERYTTITSSIWAIPQKKGLDVHLIHHDSTESRRIWYLRPHKLKAGNIECVQVVCLAPEEERQKYVTEVREKIHFIDEHLGKLERKSKTYKSILQEIQGEIIVYHRNYHTFKLIEKQESIGGRTLTKYYFSDKQALLAILRTEWHHTSQKFQEVQHEDLFFNKNKIITALEKFGVEYPHKKLDTNKLVATDITQNIGNTIDSKSKRHIQEVNALIKFAHNNLTYDESFKY